MLGGNLDYTWFGSSGYAGMYLKDPTAVVPVLTRLNFPLKINVVYIKFKIERRFYA
jgi:hypothetical protein